MGLQNRVREQADGNRITSQTLRLRQSDHVDGEAGVERG